MDLQRLTQRLQRRSHPLADLVVLGLVGLALWLICPLFAAETGVSLPAESLVVPGLLLLAGTFAGRLATRVRLPRLTGYILVGALLGPELWQLVHEAVAPSNWLRRIAFLDADQVKHTKLINDLAIGLIALMAGAEIRLSWLRKRLRPVLSIVAVKSLLLPPLVLAVLLLFPGVFPFMGQAVDEGVPGWLVALLVGTIALASSPMVVVSVIKETASRGPLSETAMGVAVLKDIVVILLFTVVIALLGSIAAGAEGASTGLLVQKGGQTLLYLFVSLLLGLPIGWFLAMITERGDRRVAWLVVGIALVVAVLEPVLHVKPLFCLLAAGFTCENLYRGRSERGSHRLERALNQVAAPVFVMFFVAAGLGLKLGALLASWGAVLLLFGSRLVALVIAIDIGARFGRAEEVVRRLGWATMMPQAGVTLGLAIIIDQQFDGWGDVLSSIIVATVALHELVGPVLLSLALRWAGEARTSAGAH